MEEDTWMKCEREFFVGEHCNSFDVPEKTLNKVLKKYNEFLQKALLGESPYVAEDLKLTILNGGKVDREQEN